jgi:hypothetical protein
MTRSRTRTRRWAALALLLALGTLAGAYDPAPARGAAPRQDVSRIVVTLLPDAVGDGPQAPACPGCDRAYGTADETAGEVDPLPAIEVMFFDEAGTELGSKMTNPLSGGRQATFFVQEAPGTYDVEFRVPSGWEVCPNDSTFRRVTAADFDEDGVARVEYFLWRGCELPATATPTATQVPTVESTATATIAPPTATITPPAPTTVLPTDEGDGEEDGAAPAGAVDALQAPMGEGEIRGLVYVDVNGDAALGPDEPGLSGVVVRLEGPAAGIRQETGPPGTFAFTGLSPSAYTVSVEVPAGWRPTTTDRYVGVRVQGDVVAGVDFGLVEDVAAAAPPTLQPPISPAPAVPSMPRTGVSLPPTGRLLLGLAALVGALGLVGLALEPGFARHLRLISKGRR